MEEIKLDVQLRAELGKSGSKKVRRSDGIPAIVYGGKQKPVTVSVDRRSFERVTRGHRGESIIFHITVLDQEKKVQDFPAVIKETQHNPVSSAIAHIDFARISLTEKIEVKVPIAVQGEPIGVKKDGGSVDHQLWELKIVCLPTQIPQHIDIDISHLEINQAVFVRDLKLPEGVVAHHDPDAVVVTVVPPMKEVEATEGEAQTTKEPEVTKEKKKEEPAAEGQAAAKAKEAKG